MDFSIIINTHNQSKYLSECIKTCLNQNYLNYEVIVVDTSNRPSKDKFKNLKKLRYFHIKEKFKNFPVLNQMHQIKFGLRKSKGKYICLLDGDDKFSSLKLPKISKMFSQSSIKIIQDIPILFSKDFFEENKIKEYKKNVFFQKIFVSWPQVFGTSSISCSREMLVEFFKKGKPFYFSSLAIDVKLMLYAYNNSIYVNKYKGITFKRLHRKNLDKNFSSLMSRSFWLRRSMQIEYNYYLNGKITFNLDYILTKAVCSIL